MLLYALKIFQHSLEGAPSTGKQHAVSHCSTLLGVTFISCTKASPECSGWCEHSIIHGREVPQDALFRVYCRHYL